jgi:hypothetical protein
VKLNSWQEIGSDGDVLLTPYDSKGITGYDDDDEDNFQYPPICVDVFCVIYAIQSLK